MKIVSIPLWIGLGVAAHVQLAAHHAWPVNQQKLITVKGTVVDFQWGNPHPMITITVAAANGSTEKWQIGGPAINRMEANGWTKTTVKAGDVVTGIGYQFTNGDKIIKLERVFLGDGKEMRVYGR